MDILLKLACVSWLLISCSSKHSIKYITDLEQANIKGCVTKFLTETYNVDSLGQVGKLESMTIEIFNKLEYTSIDITKRFDRKNRGCQFFDIQYTTRTGPCHPCPLLKTERGSRKCY